MRKTKEEKTMEKLEEEMFKKHGSGIQFDIFDLSKLSEHFKMKVRNGYNADEAMMEAVTIYRVN